MPENRHSRKAASETVQSPQSSNKPSALERTIATGAVTLGVAALAPVAHAATFTVTNTTDNSAGSLRAAVLAANANPGPDVIQFDSATFSTDKTITLTSGEIKIYESVDIVGPTNSRVTVDAGGTSRIFYMYYPAANNAPPRPHVIQNITLSNLTMTNGSYTGSSYGGGAVVDWGDNLTLDHVTISGNQAHSTPTPPPANAASAVRANHAAHARHARLHADSSRPHTDESGPGSAFTGGGKGGGLAKFEDGFLHVRYSNVTGNTGDVGGGIYVDPGADDSYIKNSVIDHNNAYIGGGIGLYNPSYDLSIQNTLVTYNEAFIGGALFDYATDGGSIAVDHSTFSYNSATYGGGAFFAYASDPVTFTDTSFFFNHAEAISALGFLTAPYESSVDFSTFAGNGSANPPASTGAHAAMNTGTKGAPRAHSFAGRGAAHAQTARIHHGNRAAWKRAFQKHGHSGGATTTAAPQVPSGTLFVGGPASSGSSSGHARTNQAVSGTFEIHNSLMAYNSPSDLGGYATFVISYSLISNTDSTTVVADHSFLDGAGDPDLQEPADNGGPAIGDTPGGAPNAAYLPTAVLDSNSDAIDTGDDSDPVTTDERSYPRPAGAHVDMGAYEAGAAPPNAVPTLGSLGKILLALTTMITGWFAIDRKRFLG